MRIDEDIGVFGLGLGVHEFGEMWVVMDDCCF